VTAVTRSNRNVHLLRFATRAPQLERTISRWQFRCQAILRLLKVVVNPASGSQFLSQLVSRDEMGSRFKGGTPITSACDFWRWECGNRCR
jgi:hypothetical protein